MTEAHGLRDAYDQLEHEVVECSPSLSVPVSTPAQFAYADTPGVTDAEAIADRIADSPIAFLDVSTTNGDAWYEFHVSGSAYDDDNGGGCTATITTVGVTFVRATATCRARVVRANRRGDRGCRRRAVAVRRPRREHARSVMTADRTNLYAGPGFDNDTDD